MRFTKKITSGQNKFYRDQFLKFIKKQHFSAMLTWCDMLIMRQSHISGYFKDMVPIVNQEHIFKICQFKYKIQQNLHQMGRNITVTEALP